MSKRYAPNANTKPQIADAYAAFDAIDGQHPWQTAVPEGYILYPVRRLEKGRVLYFNFALAREMGLLPPQHGDVLTPELEKKLLNTFCLQIVNEYDQQNGKVDKRNLREKPYMATRYLQLQHSDKRGRTSGDGRSIWNGSVTHKGTTWDVSSRGTGVTRLAPGAVEADRPLKTGAGEFGYGCGLADVSELLGSALLSEIFHLNGIGTERVLTVIDLGKGCGIGVRAAPNLIRPAHLFLFLKQGRLEPLRQATDYLIERQAKNGQWRFSTRTPDRYRRMLSEIARDFARFSARLERDYIFAWMDWDGDNLLANAGIIDYGSIRQFGLRHDQYRYDDVDRFSTTLNEQRGKARLMVQVFAQLTNFLETGHRRAIGEFASHPAVIDFDREFDKSLRRFFLAQVGFNDEQVEKLLASKPGVAEDLYRSFLTLEKTKTRAGEKRVPDGVNRPAVFNMRAALRELPSLLAPDSETREPAPIVRPEELLNLVASSFAKKADRRLSGQLRERLERFLDCYHRALNAVCSGEDRAAFFTEFAYRAEERNRAKRITGNGAEFVVAELIKANKRGADFHELHAAINLFIASQVPKSALRGRRPQAASLQSLEGRLFQELVNIVEEFEDDI